MAVGAAIRAAFLGDLGTRIPFVTFLPAALFAFLFSGATAGLLAVLLSIAYVSYAIAPLGEALIVRDPADRLVLFISLLCCLLLHLFAKARHHSQLQAAEAAAQCERAEQHRLDAAKIKESESRHRALFEHSMDAIFLTEADGKVTAANPAACALFGRSEEELCALGRAGIIDRGDPGLPAALRERADSGKVRCELTCVRKDGTKFLSEVSSVLLDDALHSFVVMRDISERKKAELALQESEGKYHAIVEACYGFLYICSQDFKIEYMNDKLIQRTGHDATGEYCYKALHDLDSVCSWCVNDQVFLGNHVNWEVKSPKDGRWYHVSNTPIRHPDGHLSKQAIITDITERKQAEELLKRSELDLTVAQAISHVGSWRAVFNEDGERWSGSEELYRIYGYPVTTPITLQALTEYIHPDDLASVLAAWSAAGDGTGPPEWEHRIIVDGQIKWVYVRVQFVMGTTGRLLEASGVVQDITERTQMLEEMRLANLNLEQRVLERTVDLEAAISEQESFSYSVSHDLRAPLRHINGFSAILREDYGGDLPAEARNYLERIVTSTKKMGTMIDHLLELSRVNRTEISHDTVNMTAMAKGIATMLRETDPQRRVEFLIEEDLLVLGDRALLQQLLGNLFGNAWKYSAGNPAARIELGRALAEGKEALFVRDNGVGFDMAYSGKLFEIFQRLHGAEFEGTGIGLATAHRIIKRHGGHIWAEGKVNEGATFYFTCQLPSRSGRLQHVEVPNQDRGTPTTRRNKDDVARIVRPSKKAISASAGRELATVQEEE